MNHRLGAIISGFHAKSSGQFGVEPRRIILLKSALCLYTTEHTKHTLFALSGLLISISGDCTSNDSRLLLESGDLVSSSCTSSSISVLSVPFESTGDGSICCGYGLAGGASESVGPDDLFA
jgi:hypothetical protein